MTNHPPQAPVDVVVIGAGIVGVATALWLRRHDCRVMLIDQAAPGDATSYGNAGVLAASSIVPVTVPGLIANIPSYLLRRDSPLYLRARALPRLLPWLIRYLRHCNAASCQRIATGLLPIVGDSFDQHRALAAGSEAEAWIHDTDLLYLYRNRHAYQRDAFAWNLRRDHGLIGDTLEGAALHDYQPCFDPELQFGVRMPHHGFISDPGRYIKALADQFIREGGSFFNASVNAIETGAGNGVAAIITDNAKRIACRHVVIAAGIGSKTLLSSLGIKVPLESERGYHLELEAATPLPSVPVMAAAHKIAITPMQGRLRCAGLVEFAGSDAPPNPACWDLLRRLIRSLIPGLQWDQEKTWMGHRPALPDSLPMLGALREFPDIYTAFGHHHIGLTGGPRSGRLIADLIAGKHPNIDLQPYDPNRFH